MTDLFILFPKNNLSALISNVALNAASNGINKFERGASGKGAVRAEKRFTLFISNEDMDDIIKTVKSLEGSEVLIDRVIEAVKDEIKKQEGGFLTALLAPLAASVVQLVTSSVANCIAGRRVMGAGRVYNNMDKNV